MLDVPNYVLRANESAWMPKKNPGVLVKMKPVVITICIIIFVLSILFRENIFSQLNFVVRILLIGMVARLLFVSKDEEVPSPIELQFYDDRLVLYRDCYYHSKRIQRREWDTFYYKDITQCVLRTQVQKLCFMGTHNKVCYNFNKDGTLSDTPSFEKHIENGIDHLYVRFSPDVDFVREIENHSPIKISVEDT